MSNTPGEGNRLAALSSPRSLLAEEHWQTLLAAVGFGLLLCSYYVLRPVRDSMAVYTDPKNIPWLFTATFVATLAMTPLFGWIVQRCPRRWLIPMTYGFMLASLGGFHVAFLMPLNQVTAVTFFIWLSLFNLMVISLFWSGVSDLFSTDQARRRYGQIGAGGTAGAIAGPALTSFLAERVSIANLILISMVLLLGTLVILMTLSRTGIRREHTTEKPIGGSIFAGLTHTFQSPLLSGIAGIVMCYSAISTVLYIEMTDVVRQAYSETGQRTAFFARIDLAVNVVALVVQLFLTQHVIGKWNLRGVLSIVPATLLVGLIAVGSAPRIWLYALIQVVHRAGEFSFSKPGREILFTTVDAENRYKAKNFIDTAVYRANDTGSAWVIAAMRQGGWNTVWCFAVPAVGIWLLLAQIIGRRGDRKIQEARLQAEARDHEGPGEKVATIPAT